MCPVLREMELGFNLRILFFKLSEKDIVRDLKIRCSAGESRSVAAMPHQQAPTWKDFL